MARGNYEDEEEHPPLLQTSHYNLTGTVWTAIAHFIAGVIGSGVLSLAWSIAQLGWIAGPLCVIIIALFALVSAFLISDIHVYTNLSNGSTTTNHSFLQAVHSILVGGYQIYSQTLFGLVERWYSEKHPESILTRDIQNLNLSLWPEFRLTRLRLCFRTTYVVLTVAVGMLFPYFNEVLAFAGSIIFWPLTIYFPVEMYFVHKKVVPWTRKWIVLRLYSSFCLFVTVFTLVGSLQGLISKRFG